MNTAAIYSFMLLATPCTLLAMEAPPDNEIFDAIKYRGIESVSKLLESGTSVNIQGLNNNTPLHYAAWLNLINITWAILAKKPDINAQNVDGDTPLHFAASRCHKKIVTILLANNADQNIINNKGISASTLIKRMAFFGTIIDLIEKYQNPYLSYNKANALTNLQNIITCAQNVGYNINENSPLLHIEPWCWTTKYKPLISLLLKNGARANRVNLLWQNGKTPLHYIAYSGSPEIMELVLPYATKTDVNQVDNSGDTPIDVACERKWVAIAELLLGHGAEVNRTDQNGNTLLHRAVVKDHNIELIKLLLDYNADTSIKNKAGKTPLDLIEKTDSWGITSSISNYLNRSTIKLLKNAEDKNTR
jgi:ankyrin repeat protein